MLGQASSVSSSPHNKKVHIRSCSCEWFDRHKNVSKNCFENIRINVNLMGWAVV